MSEDSTFKMELEGGNSLAVLCRVVDLVSKQDSINSFSIEIEFDGEFTLDPTIQRSVEEMDVGLEFDTAPELINFHNGSEAATLARCFATSDDGWMNTGEVKRAWVDHPDLPNEKFSQLLWDLSERGVLEKRQCDDDGRMNEYRISELGLKSVKASR